MREPILIFRVLLKPAHPEDLDLLSLGPLDLLFALVVDRDSEDVNESAILIRVGVVIFGSSNHDIRSRAEVNNI